MRKIFCSLFVLGSMVQASMIGLDAIGQEQFVGGNVAMAGRGFAGNAKTGEAEGYSILNPARNAFDVKTVFNLNFLLDMTTAERGGVSYSTNDISMPSFNFSFPMGSFGAVGLSLWQSYASTFKENIEDEKKQFDAELEYQGSIYEVVPSYSVRLPFFRQVSIGGSAHFLMGSNSRRLTLGPDTEGISDEDSWATNTADVSDYVDGTWEIKNHPAYYTAAIQYRGRQTSYFFSFTTPHTLLNELNYNLRFSEVDTLVPTGDSREIKVPAMLATGINFKMAKRHNIMADLSWKAWDENIENIGHSWNLPKVTETQSDFLASIGYERTGSSLFYDPYLDRMTYRAGAWFKNWYIKDVYEVGGSVGAGFPLGRKGTTIDLALQGGRRFADDSHNWDEMFVAVRLGLMGIGQWGNTQR
ncbi:MAG: hypothetical protein HUK21_01260 [Fibrobacteraceae bacterium]|nr:hypothetical protein [Fibrobacteraceae bacterium]